MKELIQKLPKSELHVHVRGAIPVEVFADLLNKYSIADVLGRASPDYQAKFARYDNIRPFLLPPSQPWTVEAASRIFQFETFEQFLDTFNFMGFFLREVDDVRRLALGVVESLKSQNVVYAEITISIKEYMRQNITLEDILACLEEASRVPGIRVQWIVDLVRDFGSAAGLALLKDIVALQSKSIVGLTLGGAEHLFPPDQFVEVYNVARDNGLRLTVHAGEALGPESVWDALRLLGAERIGHGVRAIEDPSLVKYLAEKDIPLEVCPTSNLCTGIYKSYSAHPVKALFEAGVPITINSDDPTFFGTTLADEYAHVYDMGVTEEGIHRMLTNGFKYAFLPKSDVEDYLSQFEREWGRLLPQG